MTDWVDISEISWLIANIDIVGFGIGTLDIQYKDTESVTSEIAVIFWYFIILFLTYLH